MEITLIRNFLLAMVAIVNPLGKIPIWIEASEGCDGPVRVRLALLVTGTATVLLLLFLFFGQSMDIDSSTSRRGDDALDQAKARFRDIVVPVAVPILAGPGSITTTLLFGIRAEEWADRLLLGGLLVGVMVIVLVLLLLGHRIQDLVGPLVLNVQTRIWGLLLTAIAAQMILVGLGESFPNWLDAASPLIDDVQGNAGTP